jgi:ribosome biogenesis GTPase
MRRPARVIQSWANRAIALGAAERLTPFHLPRRIERPLPGDQVLLDDRDELVELIPRRNQFGRGDARGRFRAIAANLDQALIVIAPTPSPSPSLIPRYLTACAIAGIDAIIIINKSDLPMPDQAPFTQLEALAELGVSVIATRCRPQANVSELAERLAGRTSLIAGQSGVGKTSLVNALIPDLERQTGQLSRVTGKGRHTTTSAVLCQLPDEGWLVDTPGVWEYGLWAMPLNELARGFPEFAGYSAHCRFRDCSHRHEPGCGVRAAVGQGELERFRYEAWIRLLGEQDRLAGVRERNSDYGKR